MSISDLFGLNSPRGLLDFGNSASNWTNGFCAPPVTDANLQVSLSFFRLLLKL